MVDVNLVFKNIISPNPKVRLLDVKPLTLIRYFQYTSASVSTLAVYLGKLSNGHHLIMDMQGSVQYLPTDIANSESELFQIISGISFDIELKEDEIVQNSRPESLSFRTIFRYSKNLILKLHNSSSNEMVFFNINNHDNILSSINDLKGRSADTTYTGVITLSNASEDNEYSINIKKYTVIHEECNVPVLNIPKLPADSIIPVVDLVLNTRKANMGIGDTLKLEYEILPSNATYTQVKWESSKPEIFSVVDGVVTCHNYGSAEIYLKTMDDKFVQILNIDNELPSVSSASFENDYTITGIAKPGLYLEVYTGSSNLLYRDLVPSDGIFNVTLDKAYNSGESFQLRLINDEGYHGSLINVTTRITPKYVTISKDNTETSYIRGDVGEEGKFTATFLPVNASDLTGYWSSSDVNVAYIRQDGTYKLLKKGSAIISFVSNADSDIKATVEIDSVISLQSISFEGVSEISSDINTTGLIVPKLTPFDAEGYTLEWTVSNPNVLQLGINGAWRTLTSGFSDIMVKDLNNPNIFAKYTVYAEPQIKSMSLQNCPTSIAVGESVKLIPAVFPTNTSARNGDWKSSNTSVATIDNNGILTTHGIGHTNITLKIGAFTDMITISVSEFITTVNDILFETDLIQIKLGQTIPFVYKLLPENPRYKQIDIYSAAPNIVDIEDGMIVTKEVGYSEITVLVDNGIVLKNIPVNVLPSTVEANDVNIIEPNGKIRVGDSVELSAEVLPLKTDDKTLTWNSSNKGIATINGNILKALTKGVVEVQALTVNDVSDKVNIEIYPENIITITDQPVSYEAVKNEPVMFNCTASSSTSDPLLYTWEYLKDATWVEFDNTDVNSIIADGFTYRVKVSSDGAKDVYSDTAVITIPDIYTGSISSEYTDLEVGAELDIKVSNLTKNGEVFEGDITWITSDPEIASVNNGKAIALSEGPVLIMAKITDTTYSLGEIMFNIVKPEEVIEETPVVIETEQPVEEPLSESETPVEPT